MTSRFAKLHIRAVFGITMLTGALSPACRSEPRSGSAPDAAETAPSADRPPLGEPVEAGGEVSNDDVPVETVRRPDGGMDRGCRGRKLSLLAAVLDPRCAVSERDWNARVRPGAASDDLKTEPSIRQEARRERDAIVLTLVNGTKGTVGLPLRFHPTRPELAFSVLAEPKDAGIYELVAPGNDAPPPPAPSARPPARGPSVDLGDAGSPNHVYHAMIYLPPGGVAEARLTIDPRIAQRLDRECRKTSGDAAGCVPARLDKGPVVLHVGQLVAPTVVGAPARVDWDAP